MSADDEASARAAARRERGYPGEVVRSGTPKGLLYAKLDPLERLERMRELCRAQWLAAGGKLVDCPRDELPGEVFVIEHG